VQEALALLREEFLAGFQVRKAPAFMHWVAEQRQALQALARQTVPAPLLPSHNLPGQLTPFFGREQEIDGMLCLLGRNDYRLLSIVGEGGVGKTRLALAVAQRILDSAHQENPKSKLQNRSTERGPGGRERLKFPDGVWFVPLAGLTVAMNLADQLATAIGQALGFAFSGQGAPSQQILHYLAAKQLLLILDNFEQVAADPSFIIELLQKTSAVGLLITSRRRLNIQAEYPWPITGLPLPEPAMAATLAPSNLDQFAGAALFIERARRADPTFQVDKSNQAAIAQICQTVQGLPLGIELAAALLKEYSCADLAAALAQDYTILATTLPDFADRHRNMKRVIDHSWRLLSKEERAVLSRCAIFRGRFDQEAAAVVAGANPALLTRLQDQSLLHWSGEGSGHRYFVLHELVRHYAIEQLTPLALHAAHTHHATYFMTKLQQAEATIRHQGVSQQLVQCDLDNLRAAWAWSVAQADFALVAQGVAAFARLYRMMGFHQEAYYAFHAALAAVRQREFAVTPAPCAHLLVALLNHTAEFCRYLDRLDEAEALAQEALGMGEQMGDVALRGWSYHELARIAQRRHQHTPMRVLAQQAQQLTANAGDGCRQALCLNTLAIAEVLCGNVLTAIDCYHAALRHLQHAPDRELEATVRANLGGAYKRNRDYTLAVDYLVQAVAIVESSHDQYGAAISKIVLGNLWLELGAYEQAQTTFTQALRSFDHFLDRYWEVWGRTSQAHLWQLCGDPAAAARECRQLLPLVQDKMPLLEHRTLTYLGDALCALGEASRGEEQYWRSWAMQQKSGLHFRLAEPVIRLAHLLLARQDTAAAQALLEEPLAQLMQQGPATVAEPFALYLISYHVFQANGDRRANTILQQAHNVLQTLAASISESALRQSFLENVQPHRELMALIART